MCFALFQCVLRVLRAVPLHRVRHRSEPERLLGLDIRGDDRAAGLRAVGRPAGQHHHRHDPGQHVWRHVAVGHQPERGLPGEPGHGEKARLPITSNRLKCGFVPHSPLGSAAELWHLSGILQSHCASVFHQHEKEESGPSWGGPGSHGQLGKSDLSLWHQCEAINSLTQCYSTVPRIDQMIFFCI